MLAARSRIPRVTLMDVELSQAVPRERSGNAFVQAGGKCRGPRVGGRNGLRVGNLLAVEEIAPGGVSDAQTGRQPEQTRSRAVIRPSSTFAYACCSMTDSTPSSRPPMR